MTLEKINKDQVNEKIINTLGEDVKKLKQELLKENTQNDLFDLQKSILINNLTALKDTPWDALKNNHKRTLSIQTALKVIEDGQYNP